MVKRFHNTCLVSLIVLPDTDLTIHKRQNGGNTDAYKYCGPAISEDECFALFEQEGGNNVAQTVADEQPG